MSQKLKEQQAMTKETRENIAAVLILLAFVLFTVVAWGAAGWKGGLLVWACILLFLGAANMRA